MTYENKCFVICPIGGDGTETRQRGDRVFNLIKRALSNVKVEPIRSDHISESGSITRQVLLALREAPVVVADLTDLNANVMYELGVRHATARPWVLIASEGQRFPFDVADLRILNYSFEFEKAEQFIKSLGTAVELAISEWKDPFALLELSADTTKPAAEDRFGTIRDALVKLVDDVDTVKQLVQMTFVTFAQKEKKESDNKIGEEFGRRAMDFLFTKLATDPEQALNIMKKMAEFGEQIKRTTLGDETIALESKP